MLPSRRMGRFGCGRLILDGSSSYNSNASIVIPFFPCKFIQMTFVLLAMLRSFTSNDKGFIISPIINESFAFDYLWLD
jgi:hypothetical protein